MTKIFRSRVAPSFENAKPGEQLFEVVTPDGERIGSSTDPSDAYILAFALNRAAHDWLSVCAARGGEPVLDADQNRDDE